MQVNRTFTSTTSHILQMHSNSLKTHIPETIIMDYEFQIL
eukprot:UN14307